MDNIGKQYHLVGKALRTLAAWHGCYAMKRGAGLAEVPSDDDAWEAAQQLKPWLEMTMKVLGEGAPGAIAADEQQ